MVSFRVKKIMFHWVLSDLRGLRPICTLILLAGAGCILLSVAPANAQGTLSPPTGTLQPPGMDNSSALPDAGEMAPRSPGLDLPMGAPDLMPGQMQEIVKSEEEIEAEIRDAAYNAALTGLLPLEPNEIRGVKDRYDRTQEAVEVPNYPYPQPEVVVKNIPLDPGSAPVEIKVAVGHVTTVNFLDVSGAQWPIQDVSWAGNFEILQAESGGNVIRITPLAEYAYGNLSIRLVQLKTPITFVLKTHREGVFYRMDARIPEYGPLATPPIINAGITIAAGNPAMTAILDGMPPDGAERMNVDGVDGRTTAYRHKGMMYVRSPLTLLSPAWTGSVRSADGMNVYTMGEAPVLLLSDQGKMVRARISERTAQQ
jgi:intracellular multiplication protein IcmK